MDLITFKYAREMRPTENPRIRTAIDTRWSLRLDMQSHHTCMSLEKQTKYGSSTWHPDSSYVSWGVSSKWSLGYERIPEPTPPLYVHHLFAIGPLYVAWSRG